MSPASLQYQPGRAWLAREFIEQPPEADDILALRAKLGDPSLIHTVREESLADTYRAAVAPVRVELAVVAGSSWRHGLEKAGRFAPFCARAVALRRGLTPGQRRHRSGRCGLSPGRWG